MAAPRDTWPCGRGFQRWYGFHGGETHQFVPTLFQDNHAVSPAAARDDGYHLSEDLADRAIRYLGELRSVEPERPFFLYFATGACHSPHHAPRRVDRPVPRAGSTRVGTRGASNTFARQQAMGLLPPGTRLSPRPPWVPAWDDLDPEDQQRRRALHGVLRRLPLARRRADRARARVRRGARRTGRHARRRSSRTTARAAEGGARARSTTPACGTAIPPAAASSARASTSSAGRPRTTTTRGAGRWRATRRSGAGSARCTRAASPIRASCTGRAASPAAVACVTSSRTRSTCSRPCSSSIGIEPPDEIGGVAQSPIEGTSFAYLLDDADAPERHTTQYFEMLGSRGIYHEGWKAVTFKPLGRDVRRRPRPRRAVRRRRAGSCTTWRRPVGVRRPRRDAAREAGRAGRPLVDGGAPVPGAAARQPTRSPRCSRRGDPSTTDGGTCSGPAARLVPETVTVNVRNRTHSIVATVDVSQRRDARRRAARDGERARRVVVPRASRPSALRAQLPRQGAPRRRVGRRRARRAPTSSRSRSRAPATSGAPGACCSTASSSVRPRSPTSRPCATRSPAAASRAAGSRARRSATATRHRSGSRARCSGSSSRSTGILTATRTPSSRRSCRSSRAAVQLEPVRRTAQARYAAAWIP